MTKKGKKKKQTAAASTSEDGKLQQTLQQQATPESTSVQAIPGPSQQQQQKVIQDQSQQQTACGPQQPGPPQQQSIQQGQPSTAWGPRQPGLPQQQSVQQGQPPTAQGSRQPGPPQQQPLQQSQPSTAWGPRQPGPPQQQSVQQGQPPTAQGSRQPRLSQQQPLQQGQPPTAWGPRQPGPSQQQPLQQGQPPTPLGPRQPGPRQQQPLQQGQPPTPWGPRQPGPSQQQPLQQGQPSTAWGPRQPGPPQQQPLQQGQPSTAWGPRQPGPPQQQSVQQGQPPTAQGSRQPGPSQQQPLQQSQPPTAWGPRQPGPSQQQPLQQGQPPTPWGPRQPGPPQQQPLQQGQPSTAWGSRQPGPPQQQPLQQSQPSTAWGPRQPGPPQQQSLQQGQPSTAWGPRQPGPPQQQSVQQGQPPTAQGSRQPGPPQQQPLQQSQPSTAWGPRQRGPPHQQPLQQGQPPTARGPQQPGPSQQQTPIDIGAGGDTQQIQISQLSLEDPFHSPKMEKGKMSSTDMVAYQSMIPKRQDPTKAGTMGQRIKVYTNMFEIIFAKNFVTNAVHYDVTIKPIKSSKSDSKKDSKKLDKAPKLPKALCRNIFEQCRNQHFGNRYPAYDGNKNAYSANDLPFSDSMQAVVCHKNENGQQKQYEIIINKVANVDLSWIKNLRPGLAENREQTAMQVLDIIMRHAPESRFTNVGRSFFWDVNERELLGGGLALSRGGFMAGVLGWQPYLNVDVSHKGFTIRQKVLTYITEVVNQGRYRDPIREDNLTYNDLAWNKTKIQSFLRGLKVIYEIPNSPTSKRTYRVVELYDETSDSHKFTDSEGRECSITEYFWQYKKYKICRTNLHTLHVGVNARGGKVLLPLELCTIMPGQAYNKKLDETQTTNMIKRAATDAFTRKDRIAKAFETINVNRSPVMEKEFHLSVSAQMKQVDARILAAPQLKYAGGTANVAKGVWRLQPFNQAKNLETNSWTILDLSGKSKIDDFIQAFVKMLQSNAREVGMNIDLPLKPFKSFRTERDLKYITEFFNKNKNLKLIIVIIPNRTDITYGNVKKITEMEVGVLTQCVKIGTVERVNHSTAKNILLKINSKLNGVNHTLNIMPMCLQSPCMLIGADVTHPSPDSKDTPSIAAVAASRNPQAFQYNVALRLQPPKEEMILDLEEIILSQLCTYREETKSEPKKVIYYRDGVSEGQLPQVMYHEINAIKKAIYRFTKGQRNIEVTCLVVQKRHHVRLFPTDKRESDDRNFNVRAGTIVDTNITHPDHIDFYLVSHASIQGTARPTKYRCICNESNFNEDQLEELTYYLCHMYARCTRSVSYPAPTYYAHLAAYRGRALLQGIKNFKLDNLEREQRNFMTMKMAGSPMYFV
ncbi:protein argonaute-2 [Monomorium pharaonis]|uniref:protein argonaute-2 n=1 Tax=Monomorium pharaonis TaxID=307658 RepID=UPI001745FC72|nr:protein argonaute-2 [Monomorium pharaonis]